MRQRRRDASRQSPPRRLRNVSANKRRRLPEHRNEEKHPQASAGTLYPLLSEVDLQLVARWNFDADGRQRRHVLRHRRSIVRMLSGTPAPRAVAAPRPILAAGPVYEPEVASGSQCT
jgi:hypothetical protein